MRMIRYRLFSVMLPLFLLLAGAVSADTEQIITASVDLTTGVCTESPLAETEAEDHDEIPPYIPEGAAAEIIPPYKIIGKDERTIIKYSPDNFPYTAVVKLYTEFTGRDGSFPWKNTCSGFMIGPNYAATAAHCIYAPATGYAVNKNYEGWAKSVKICPAAADRNEPFGCAYAVDMRIMDAAVNMEYDAAVLKLEKPLGNKSGWMGSYILGDSECRNYAQLLGYALDTDMKYMFYSYGQLDGTNDNGKILKYKLDTLPGSSGGPLIIYHKDQWGYLVGINVADSDNQNFAVRLTNQVYNFFAPYWGK